MVSLDRLLELRRQAQQRPETVRPRVNVRGVPVSTRGGTRQPATQDEGLTAEDLLALMLGQDGGGGGGGGLSAAERQAEIRLEARLAAKEAGRRRGHERAESRRERKARQEETRRQLRQRRKENIRNLRSERQKTFVDLLGRNQARAVLFALGLGPQADIFTTRAQGLEATLKPLKGARGLEQETESALAALLGQPIDIGARGVEGLGTAQGAATAFQQGGLTAQKLLAGAFDVGDLGTGQQPGISADELVRIIESVTPQGVF